MKQILLGQQYKHTEQAANLAASIKVTVSS